MLARSSVRSFAIGLLACCSSPFVLGATCVRAQGIEGRTRLALDLVPIEIASASISPEAGGESVDTTTTNIGLAPSVLGLQLAYGASENALVGLRLQLASQQQTVEFPDSIGLDSRDQKALTVRFLPYVSYVGGGPENAIRGTVSAMIGYASTTFDSGGDDGSQSGLVLGATAGLLGFVAGGFSVDPALYVLHQFGSAEADGTTDLDFTSTSGGVLVTFSGWVGERPSVRAANEDEALVEQRTRWSGPTTRSAPPPAPPAADDGLLSVRATLDGVALMLLAQPETRGAAVALRLSRFVTADEAPCQQLEIVVDGTVVSTLPLQSQRELRNGVPELKLQATTDLTTVDRMLAGSQVELRWCGTHRRLTLASASSMSEFARRLHERLGTQPAPAAATTAPAPATPAPTVMPEPTPSTTPAPGPSAPAPSAVPALPPSAPPAQPPVAPAAQP